MSLINELREHIVKQYLKGVEPSGFDEDYDLIVNGILDSLALMNLITHVEQTYGITFGEYDITPETFETITALADYIDSRREGEESVAPVETVSVTRTRSAPDEPIAIIGMGCRFPGGANTPEKFWELLRNGVDTATEIPAERWDIEAYYDPNPGIAGKMYVRSGSFLSDIDQFDPHFFGIAPLEATTIDPQQRLLLEVSWEALENAGIAADSLRDTLTGVFTGVFWDDYSVANLYLDQPEQLNGYRMLSNLRGMNAGRLAYVLGTQGPAMQVDTACSASLLGVHLACQALRNQECHLALAGGVDLNLSPERTIALCDTQALSADGRCKAFDSRADGFGQGEGCGVVVLKRLSDAVSDGDTILGVIRGSAVNHDGRSPGLTVPNGVAQKKLIQQAWQNSSVDPDSVQYIETHGTGTPLGDPTELSAIAKVIGNDRQAPLYIGSVKANIGHLSSAAGAASLIKVVLSLQHKEISPQLHFEEPNPHIPWNEVPFTVSTEPTPWPANNGSRLAGISSFGLTGTNVHVVVSEWQDTESTDTRTKGDRPGHLLTLSGKSEGALADQVKQYLAYLPAHPELSLGDVCYTANTGRVHFEHRLGVVATNMAELQAKLAAHQRGEPVNGLTVGQTKSERPKIAFLFTGQGAQYVDMGRELFETQPLFREILTECDEMLQPYLDISLLELLYGADKENNDGLLAQTNYTQPALFAIEYALAKLWQSWGIEPDAVIGHSVGEYVAACVAGVFSLADGLKLIAERGRLMQALPQNGRMVAVQTDEAKLSELILPYQDRVSIASLNAPHSLVLSGETEAVTQLVEQLQAEGIKCNELNVSHAFHSPLMEPMLTEFGDIARTVEYAAPQLKLIANVTGKLQTVFTADYWVEHVRQGVRFADGMATLAELGIDTFIEVGPKPTLLGLGQQCLADPSTSSGNDPSTSSGNGLAVEPVETNQKLWLPSLYPKQQGDWEQLLASLGQFHVRGGKIDWTALHAPYPHRKVSLPTYPFQRKRYWIDRPKSGRKGGVAGHPLLGNKFESPTTSEIHFANELSVDYPAYLGDHQVYEQVVVPAAAYLEMVLSASSQLGGGTYQAQNITLQQPLILSESAETMVQLVLSPNEGGYQWQIFSQMAGDEMWHLHVNGVLVKKSAPLQTLVKDGLEDILSRCTEELSIESYHQSLHEALYFGPDFQAIRQLFRGVDEGVGFIELPSHLEFNANDYHLHPVLLDACLRICEVTERKTDESSFYLPFLVERMTLFDTTAKTRLWSHVRQTGKDEISLKFDIRLFTETGEVVGELIGFGLRQGSRLAITGSTLRTDWLYQLNWQPAELPQFSPYQGEAGRWLIVGEDKGLGNQLSELLQTKGQQVDLFSNDNLAFVNYQLSIITYQTVIYIAEIDSSTECEEPAMAQKLSTQLLQLVQGIIQGKGYSTLWVVSQGTVATETDSGEILSPASATLWGLGRTIMWEIPGLQCRCLDLEKNTTAKMLFETIWYTDEENQIKVEGSQRQVARLERYSLPSTGSGNDNPIKADKSYLITGGVGGLGLKVAEWLVNQGATHVVLSSRRGATTGTAQTVIAELEAKGATVQIVKADVSQEEDVIRLLAESQQLAPLAGIIHAAGVLDDGILLEQTPERFAKVFAPKVPGSWYLHQYSQDMPLDFFVCFSSQSSLLGNGGQSNYAAANAFMDALMQERHNLGLPGLSINWGGWSEIGLAKDLVAQQGEGISPEQGIDLFGALLSHSASSGQAQVGVLPVNWRRFNQQLPSPEGFPVLSKLIEAKPAVRQSDLRQQLSEVSVEERYDLLKQHLKSEVGLIVGVVPTDEQGLFDLGMDSLMSIQLANRLSAALQITLPATLLINNNSLNSLSHVLWKLLGAKSTTKRPDDEIIIRQAVVADAPQIVKLFKSIQITPANLSKKLDETHPNRYSRTGGFFEIFSEEQMREFIEQSGYLVDLAFYKDELVAYISLIVEPSLVYKKWQQLIALEKKLDEERVATFVENFKQQKVAYPMEIVISPTYQFSDLTQLLYQRVYNYLTERGFTHTFSETYNIIYNDLEYKNPNSDLVQTLTGSEIIGYVMKAFVIDGKKIDVKSNIHIGQLET